MNLNLIKTLCKTNEQTLYEHLIKLLQEIGYSTVIYSEDYIIAEHENALPVCLIAHLDTVFTQLPHEFFYDSEKEILWSPSGAGFDDRAGVYIILELLKEGYFPNIIFTRGEEVGGIGAHHLVADYPDCPFADCRAIIQLDRAYDNDAVFYECDNNDFEKYICDFGFEFNYGTFSDISIIAPAWKIAAVNLSVGYKCEHTPCERLYCKWTDATLDKVQKILDASSTMKSYTYIPWSKPNQNYTWGFSFSDNICLLCGKQLKTGDRIIREQNDIGDYGVCDECFKAYYDPATTNSSVIQMCGEQAPESPF
jgi:hypothetical protein